MAEFAPLTSESGVWFGFDGAFHAPSIPCSSKFSSPTLLAERVLKDGITMPDESGASMVERVANELFKQEFRYDLDPKSANDLADEFIDLCDQHVIIMGTPTLTNAGSKATKPLSACSVLPVDFDREPALALKYMHAYHEAGIGLGISLNQYKDPLQTAIRINDEVLRASSEGKHSRRIGNMGTITVYHPRVMDIVHAKSGSNSSDYQWRFNFSIDCDEKFMRAVEQNTEITMLDGSLVNARTLMQSISESAAATGDPGLIFLDRLNENNPTPAMGKVKSTAPCAEVGLIEGEACQFAYVNLGKFIENGLIDISKLKRTVYLLTRALDNALDISIDNISHDIGRDVMRKKRKIGIGICGLADMLAKLNMPYNSEEARTFSKDVLALISYTSKRASVELAEIRGAAGAMTLHIRGDENLHYAENAMFEKFAHDSRYVTRQEWIELVRSIKYSGLLRNVSTIALPPTGKSALIIGASNGIEPWFTVLDGDDNVHPILVEKLMKEGVWSSELEGKIKHAQTIQHIHEIPENIRRIFVTATEMSAMDHLGMTAALQSVNDESASKTVNLPRGSTADDVFHVYMLAYQMGLCGITIYIDGSRINQPKKLVQ